MLVPGNNRSYTQAPIDEAVNKPDGILITEIPEFITVSMGEKFNVNHVLYGLMGTLYFSIDQRCISSNGINNNFVVNA